MIVKHINNPKQQSSKPSRIGSLLDYIAEANETDREKAEYAFAIGNFYSDCWQVQRAEMIALSVEATRSADPIDHWLLSWMEGEVPTHAQCREAVEILKRHLGLGKDHLAMCSLHSNTENCHLHVVLNRVHPDTLKTADTGWRIKNAHRAVAEIVGVQGWEPEKNALYVHSEHKVKERPCENERPRFRAKTLDQENATGEKSFERIAIETAAPILNKAQNWDDVHSALEKFGMRYELQGSGAVIWVGVQPVKASAIGRACSKSRMEERLGPFRSNPNRNTRWPLNRVTEPIQANMPDGWQRYEAWKDHRRKEKDQAVETQRATHREEREVLWAEFRHERNTLYQGGKWCGAALNVARSLLAAEHARRKAHLVEKHRREREELRKQLGKRLTFEEYLLRQGATQLAQSWRFRNSSIYIGILEGSGDESIRTRDIRDFIATMRMSGPWQTTAVDYRRKSNTKVVSFTDVGRRVDVVQTGDEAAVLAALQLATQKWGIVTVNGSSEFKLFCSELAAKHGFRLSNTELRPQPANSIREVSAQYCEDPYQAHKADILRRIAVPNPSSLDWMIAIRLRVTGHSKQAITESLKNHAPNGRSQEARDWLRYAERTAQAAFGPRGDREFQQCTARASAWIRVEGRKGASRVVRRTLHRELERE